MAVLQDVYDSFLAVIETDEWDTWTDWERQEDWFQLFLTATVWFKFPRVNLDVVTVRDPEGQVTSREFREPEKVTNAEVQILALYMKIAWFNRVIDSWENLRPLYTEADFSPAKQLNEYGKRLENQQKRARELESIYYRSIGGKPFNYGRLAGGR